MVSKRYFLHASGFDPYDGSAHYSRFVREAARFATTWNVSAQVAALQKDGASESRWTVTTRAPGWQVETEFVLLDWSDIVRGEIGRPAGLKLYRSLMAFADLVWSGTAWRYFSANWRYGMFFLVPFLNVFMFAAVAILAGWYAGDATVAVLPSVFAGVATAVVAASAVFPALMRWPGERWRVGQAMADWIFAREYTLGRHPGMKARLDDFAARITACARLGGVDEIVVSGHSLGAVVAADALARAFDRDPELGRRGPKLALLTIGAVIPKIALHPRGAWLRDTARRLAAEPSLTWAEYQARDDFISFYRFDPVKLLRISDTYQPEGLFIGRVQIFRMLSEASWRRFRSNYMRLHYQFVMANERRTAYDYFMLACGPALFRRTIAAAGGPASLYGADGAYLDGSSREDPRPADSCAWDSCADRSRTGAPAVLPSTANG